MIRQGYTGHCDNCPYFQQFGDFFNYLFLHFNYMLNAPRNKSLINKLKSQLGDKFEMKDLGVVKKIASMEICRGCMIGKLHKVSGKSF